MIVLPVLFNLFIGLHNGNINVSPAPDPCEEAKPGAAAATLFTKDSVYHFALTNIKNAFAAKNREYCISFGKNAAGNTLASPISAGNATSGKVPAIANAFADLHNHPNNLPPDAGDFYGLFNMHQKNPGHKTRFVVTVNGTVYALQVTDSTALLSFIEKTPPQPPAFPGGPQGFPVAITDEAREMKYRYNCTDETVLAFILEKYKTGVSLLKQQSDGIFKKLVTSVEKSSSGSVYRTSNCL